MSKEIVQRDQGQDDEATDENLPPVLISEPLHKKLNFLSQMAKDSGVVQDEMIYTEYKMANAVFQVVKALSNTI